jgi:hypothetical protein
MSKSAAKAKAKPSDVPSKLAEDAAAVTSGPNADDDSADEGDTSGKKVTTECGFGTSPRPLSQYTDFYRLTKRRRIRSLKRKRNQSSQRRAELFYCVNNSRKLKMLEFANYKMKKKLVYALKRN